MANGWHCARNLSADINPGPASSSSQFISGITVADVGKAVVFGANDSYTGTDLRKVDIYLTQVSTTGWGPILDPFRPRST